MDYFYDSTLNELAHDVYTRSVAAGWWLTKDQQNIPTKLCLIHSEISEAMEGYRKGLQDDHLPNRPMIEVELADAIIRIADLSGRLNLDLGGAVVEKMAYNEQRADHKPEARKAKHGKKF